MIDGKLRSIFPLICLLILTLLGNSCTQSEEIVSTDQLASYSTYYESDNKGHVFTDPLVFKYDSIFPSQDSLIAAQMTRLSTMLEGEWEGEQSMKYSIPIPPDHFLFELFLALLPLDSINSTHVGDGTASFGVEFPNLSQVKVTLLSFSSSEFSNAMDLALIDAITGMSLEDIAFLALQSQVDSLDLYVNSVNSDTRSIVVDSLIWSNAGVKNEFMLSIRTSDESVPFFNEMPVVFYGDSYITITGKDDSLNAVEIDLWR